MKDEVDKRLHRVKITLNNKDVDCPCSPTCSKASNEKRCNLYYKKYSLYKQKEV